MDIELNHRGLPVSASAANNWMKGNQIPICQSEESPFITDPIPILAERPEILAARGLDPVLT